VHAKLNGLSKIEKSDDSDAHGKREKGSYLNASKEQKLEA